MPHITLTNRTLALIESKRTPGATFQSNAVPVDEHTSRIWLSDEIYEAIIGRLAQGESIEDFVLRVLGGRKFDA